MKIKLRLLLAFTLGVILNQVQAAHIIGGDMTYQCVSIDSVNQVTVFNIIVTMYRDSKGGGADFDDPARFGLYRGSGNSWQFVGPTRRISPSQEQNLNNVDDPCVTVPSNVGVQSGRYEFQVTLPWSNENYKIAYQRCCRNNTITNLINPEGTGAVFEVDITPEAQRSCNNSPTFNSFPPIALCANIPLSLDVSATDEDGDQLVYSFCTPKSSGGREAGTGCTSVIPEPIDCLPPFGTATFATPTYNQNAPLGATANMNLDPVSGLLTATPRLTGQFVVGLCVQEYRNGMLLSEISRDFQFNVTACTQQVSADVLPPDNINSSQLNGKELVLESCELDTFYFKNESTSNIGTKPFLWTFDLGENNTIQSSSENLEIVFPDTGSYTGYLVINPVQNECSDTAFIKVRILPQLNADFSSTYDSCIAGPVSFIDKSQVDAKSIIDWDWIYNNQSISSTQSPVYSFSEPGEKNIQLIIEDNNHCKDTINKQILWQPAPEVVVIEPSDVLGCAPSLISFSNLSNPVDTTYTVEWEFGDGQISDKINPDHVYSKAGIYDVHVRILSPEGCETIRDFPSLITIQPSPIANFEYYPEILTHLKNEVSLSDSSLNVTGWNWYCNDELISLDQHTSYTFQDTGLHQLTLIGFHELGCSDTITQLIDVQPVNAMHFPNAFTPNNDGLNDVFKPEGIYLGLKQYEMIVWDRWGGKIFESTDPYSGWNGQHENSGSHLPQGVYPVTVKYTEARGKTKEFQNTITLLR